MDSIVYSFDPRSGRASDEEVRAETRSRLPPRTPHGLLAARRRRDEPPGSRHPGLDPPLEAVRMKGTWGWVLVYRKTGKTRRFVSLEAARKVQVKAAAKYGTRWLSLRPDAPLSY